MTGVQTCALPISLTADVDGDGDLDILSKIWNVWSENANGGTEHVDVLENTLR